MDDIEGDDIRDRRARSFGPLADRYERWRPGYPEAAVDWLLPPTARTVADVGAGTGKLTGALLRRGLRVFAVEPDPSMLAVLARVHPAAERSAAGADALPLPDDSVDAVVVGQAWHWFPHERAAAEVRRVLRPGGWLGLVWNRPAPEEPWQVEVERLTARTGRGPDAGQAASPGAVEVEGLPDGQLEAEEFRWSESLTPAHLCARLATYSHIALMAEADRAAVLAEVLAVASRAAERAGGTTVIVRQVASCVRWRPDQDPPSRSA